MGLDWAKGRRGRVAVGVVILFRRSRCNRRCRRAANRRRGTEAATFLPGTVIGRAEISA